MHKDVYTMNVQFKEIQIGFITLSVLMKPIFVLLQGLIGAVMFLNFEYITLDEKRDNNSTENTLALVEC